MPATRDGKLWRSQFYYKDWQGVRRKKNKRGFKTKGEADEWERNFLQQQQKNLDISFENFVEIYFADMENLLSLRSVPACAGVLSYLHGQLFLSGGILSAVWY